jgi:hypothetical protein
MAMKLENKDKYQGPEWRDTWAKAVNYHAQTQD